MNLIKQLCKSVNIKLGSNLNYWWLDCDFQFEISFIRVEDDNRFIAKVIFKFFDFEPDNFTLQSHDNDQFVILLIF